jgi:tetratricopeptide (TPR) repeat protein
MLSPEEQDRLATLPTESLDAYEAYLLGNQRIAEETSASLAEATTYFQQAIELAPTFALAYVGLADAYSWQPWRGGLPLEEALAKAQTAADKALELDDRLGEAYSALAAIKHTRNDLEGAEASYQRALELNPNYAAAYYSYGDLLVVNLGRPEEALALYRKALELDPFSGNIISGIAYALESLGRFDEALAEYERAIEVDPAYPWGYQGIGYHHWLVSGQLDIAVFWLRKSIALDPGNPQFSAFLGWVFLDLGDLDRAKYWIERSIELGPESFFPNLAMEGLHLYRGELSTAREYGRKAFESGDLWALEFSSFEPVRVHEMRAGRYLEARAAFEKIAPELLNEDSPKIGSRNYGAAIGVALILSKTGEQQRAERLLDGSLQYIRRTPRLGVSGYGIGDVPIYELQGDRQKALSALRRAIDEGWRSNWWYSLKQDPILESLHDEPEFQAMVAEIEADMATQLARVREMERNGELEPIPELATE